MKDPPEFTPEEIETLEALIRAAEDESVQEVTEALTAYKGGTATDDDMALLHGILGLMEDVERVDYARKLSDLEVQKRFDEAEVPPLPPATDKPEDT